MIRIGTLQQVQKSKTKFMHYDLFFLTCKTIHQHQIEFFFNSEK
jgi:hypothetical protein